MSQVAAQAAGRQRPAIVTVIGILAIAFGVMGLFALPINIMQIMGVWPGSEFTRPMFQNPPMGTWMKVGVFLTPVSCALWIISGVGLLRLRPWGRILAIGLIVFGLLTQLLMTVLMVPAMQSSVGTMFPVGSQQAAMMKTIMTASMAVGMVFGVGIMVTLLILLTRPHVRQAFEPVVHPTAGPTGASG
ncbi:MAG: hypothetical protein ACE5R4_06480 [Armatimonadota bacterium]